MGAALRIGVLVAAVGITASGCGGSVAVASPGVTCDEYSQKELAPANIGGPAQTSDIIDLLGDHGLPTSIPLMNKVQKAVNVARSGVEPALVAQKCEWGAPSPQSQRR